MKASNLHSSNCTTILVEDVDADPEIDPAILAAIAAHDLREPVQAVRSFLAVVLDGRTGPLTELQRDFLTSASEASRRIGRLIDDLQLILTEGQSLDYQGRPLNLAERALACCRELEQIAEGYAVILDYDIDTTRTCKIYGDSDRVDQILLNILENAIQYAPPGVPLLSLLSRLRTTVGASLSRTKP